MSFVTTKPSSSSGVIGYFNITAGITASTTQSQGQQALTSMINEVSTVGSTNDTVTLPEAVAGRTVIIINNGSNTLQVFPASGDAIDGAAVDTAKTQASGSNFIYVAKDSTHWDRINASI